MIKRKKDAFFLSTFTLRERTGSPPLLNFIGRFSMRTHDPASGRDPLVKQRLHYWHLRAAFGQTNTIALPIAMGPFGLGRQQKFWNISQQRGVDGSYFPPSAQEFRPPLEYRSSDN